MKILYFTASGNCLAVAKRFDAELLSIPQMIHDKQYSFQDDDSIGIVYPVYNGGLPYIVKDLIGKCKIKAPYVFVIATYGNAAMGTLHEMEKALSVNGNHADYYETLLMVDNYLPMFEMKDQVSRLEQKGTEKNLIRIVAEVNAHTQKPARSNVGYNMFAAMLGKMMKNPVRKAALSYTVSDDCIGCGICSQVCPVANVKQTGKEKPTFGASCEKCYACVHNCPKKAIHLPKEKSGERFRNSEVSLKEIIAANRQG